MEFVVFVKSITFLAEVKVLLPINNKKILIMLQQLLTFFIYHFKIRPFLSKQKSYYGLKFPRSVSRGKIFPRKVHSSDHFYTKNRSGSQFVYLFPKE